MACSAAGRTLHARELLRKLPSCSGAATQGQHEHITRRVRRAAFRVVGDLVRLPGPSAALLHEESKGRSEPTAWVVERAAASRDRRLQEQSAGCLVRKTLSFYQGAVKVAEITSLLHLETILLRTHCYSLISLSRPSSAHHFSAQEFACPKIYLSTFLSRVKQLYEILQAVSLEKECRD